VGGAGVGSLRKNKKLFSCLNKRNIENVKVFGFVNNAEELMGVSDVIITKPGGSSIAEIMNMGYFLYLFRRYQGRSRRMLRFWQVMEWDARQRI